MIRKKFREITKDEVFAASGELDVDKFLALPENLQKIGNLLRAISAPIPPGVAAMGKYASEEYRRFLYKGRTAEEARALLETPTFRNYLQAQEILDTLKEEFGGLENIPENVPALLGLGAKLDTSKNP